MNAVNTYDEAFVASPMRDNWYQSSSYWPSSFALITSVDESGTTSIGPYQLSFPYGIIGDRQFLVVSRKGSNTANHVLRTGKCAMNFIEFDRDLLANVVSLGYPGQSPQEKMEDTPFTLMESPTPGRGSDNRHPKILREAFQVYECSLDANERIKDNGKTPEYLILNIDNILLKETWKRNLDEGPTQMPHMPITFGFRGGQQFWFAELQEAFWLPVPTDKGPKEETILYEANRMDPEIQFTREAAQQLTGVPKAFLRTVLEGIVKQARERNVSQVDKAFVDMINSERNA